MLAVYIRVKQLNQLWFILSQVLFNKKVTFRIAFYFTFILLWYIHQLNFPLLQETLHVFDNFL